MRATDPVNRLMSQPVLSISVDAPVHEVIETFVAYPVHHLPVVKRKFVVGMLSSADLMKLEFFLPPPGPARNRFLQERFSIATLMRTPVITIGEHESVQRAAELMATNGIHSLPVLNELRHLIGIVTTTDVMHSCLRTCDRSDPPAQSDRFGVIDARFAEAIAAARKVISSGTDSDGIAAALLHLQERVSTLELVAHEAKRYLNAGQDERLHATLAKAIERMNRNDRSSDAQSILGLSAVN